MSTILNTTRTDRAIMEIIRTTLKKKGWACGIEELHRAGDSRSFDLERCIGMLQDEGYLTHQSVDDYVYASENLKAISSINGLYWRKWFAQKLSTWALPLLSLAVSTWSLVVTYEKAKGGEEKYNVLTGELQTRLKQMEQVESAQQNRIDSLESGLHLLELKLNQTESTSNQ